MSSRRERRDANRRQRQTAAKRVKRGRLGTALGQLAEQLRLPNGYPVDHLRCRHASKVIFATRGAALGAREYALRHAGDQVHPYPCPTGADHWHLTSHFQPEHCTCADCRRLAQIKVDQ